MTTTNKIWTAHAKWFGDLEPQIQTFLDAHPAITITDTKFYQSHTGEREHNVVIFYQVAASSAGIPLSVIIRALNKYTNGSGEDFNIISDKINVGNVVIHLPNKESAELYRLIREEKYWKERMTK